jgi:hypothetical protein
MRRFTKSGPANGILQSDFAVKKLQVHQFIGDRTHETETRRVDGDGFAPGKSEEAEEVAARIVGSDRKSARRGIGRMETTDAM